MGLCCLRTLLRRTGAASKVRASVRRELLRTSHELCLAPTGRRRQCLWLGAGSKLLWEGGVLRVLLSVVVGGRSPIARPPWAPACLLLRCAAASMQISSLITIRAKYALGVSA